MLFEGIPNFEPGHIVLVSGPYDRATAEAQLDTLRPLAPDAYLKSGW